MNYFRRKIEHHRLKKVFMEYGHEIAHFSLEKDGAVDYARWLHPFEKPKSVEQSQVDFYRQFIRPGELAIDIGAHTGDTTVPMALAAGKEGTVLGLEPNIHVFRILQKNSELNRDKTHIVPLNFAVTENDGTFVFNYSDASFCNGGYLSRIHNRKHRHNYPLEVQGKNLEKFLAANYSQLIFKLTFMKIDAEGYDKDIIRSMKGLLMKTRPYMVTECYKRLDRDERKEFYDLVREIRYLPYHMEGFDSPGKTLINSADEMLKWRHFDMVLIPEEKMLGL